VDNPSRHRLPRLVLRVLGLAIAGASVSAGSALVAAEPVSVRLAIDAPAVPESVQQAALAEVARIWTPYGFDVAAGARPSAQPAVAIRVVYDAERRGVGDELGDIHFEADGTPSPTITILYGTVVHLAESGEVLGTDPSLLPVSARDGAIGRAVGRVLAHEIGHFLLRSPHHPDSGLMRARFDAAALTSPDAGLFQLTTTDRDRLEIVRRALYAPAPDRPAETTVTASSRGSQRR
jgi:hypothetical protein